MAVGKLSEGILDETAEFAVFGLDPLKFLAVRDSFDLEMLRELLEKIKKKREIMDHNLAVQIAQNLAKVMPR